MSSTFPAPIAPTSSSLMRRLVEAMEGLPHEATAYVVADPAFPHVVHATDLELSEAIGAALRAHPEAALYGPLSSNRFYLREEARAPRTIEAIWVHDPDSEWSWIGDGEPDPPFPPAGRAATFRDLGSLMRRVEEIGADATAVELGATLTDLERVDTVAFGSAPFEKFVLPYLCRVYGAREAVRRADEFGSLALSARTRWTPSVNTLNAAAAAR